MHSEAQDRQILETDLRKAIARGELQLQYQPVVNAQTEELSGFEALVRWHHPTRGVISPEPVRAARRGSGPDPLDRRMGAADRLPRGREMARAYPGRGQSLADPVRRAEPARDRASARSPIPSIAPRQLELEITEGVFLVESESTDDMFAKLKSIGVRLALDDFGTGYSSLGYLKKAPFDKIKIDQSFVRGAAKTGSRNAAIIRAIVTLAESLGMDTTAEGAETHDELTMIRELGCSHIQGYIFGRPMNPDEAGALAAQNKAVTADGFQFNRPPRQGLLKVASLQFNGMNMPVRVRNISTGGALLECDRVAAGRSQGPARSARLRQSRRRGALVGSQADGHPVRGGVRPAAPRARQGQAASAPSSASRPIPTCAMPKAPPTRRRSPPATCATTAAADPRRARSRQGRRPA